MDLIDRQVAIDTEGLEEEIRCEMCMNPMHTNRGCDGYCKYDEKLYERIMQILDKRIKPLPSAQPEQQCGRIFQGIVVEYPEYCIYQEYKGKPYFSIKYTENGQEFIGYSTYKLDVLSEYLKEYFMPPAQPERKKGCKIVKSTGRYGYCACDQCGKPVHPEDLFCSKCGADFREEDT